MRLGSCRANTKVIYYFAGNVAGYDHILYNAGIRNKLLTFAEIDDWGKRAFDFWVYQQPEGIKLFMDCGAFSAFMRGAVIDIDRYMKFLHDYNDRIEVAVQLDCIGNPRVTNENLKIMEDNGLNPIPVYTSSAPLADLERLCERYKYIALGDLRGKEGKHNVNWRRDHLNKVFKIAHKYWPVKFHAFGITSSWVLERYPLYSVDSSSAILSAGMGMVMKFEKKRGKYLVDQTRWQEFARVNFDHVIMDFYGDIGTTGTTSAHIGRRKNNIRVTLQLEAYINQLWREKGWSWETGGA